MEIYGQDLPELFANAAFCVADLIYHPERVQEKRSIPIELSSADTDELFLDWLRELLYRFSSGHLAFSRVTIDRLRRRHLAATLFGEDYSPAKHGLKVELKTPTYHQYRLEKARPGFRATVVFDA